MIKCVCNASDHNKQEVFTRKIITSFEDLSSIVFIFSKEKQEIDNTLLALKLIYFILLVFGYVIVENSVGGLYYTYMNCA